MSQVKEILAKIGNLPPMPAVVQQVMGMMQDPNFSFAKLMETVRLDPGITAHVLRMCNSPIYGLRQEVTSLHQAMVLMGSNQLMEILLSRELVGHYQRDQDGYRLAKGELWQHSMACALLVARLGQRTGFSDEGTLFTAALLHDVGKLVLSEFVGKSFAQIEELVEQGMSFVAAERQVLGVDHALLGAALARQWNFPEVIVGAIAFHHAPDRAPRDRQLTHLVALANLLCMSLGVGQGAEGLAAPAPATLLKEVGLKSRDLDMLLLELKDILDQAGDLLSLAG